MNLDNTKWCDSHAHYDTRQFKNNLNKTLNDINKEVNLIINCATKTNNIKSTCKLTSTYDFIYGVLGYFPCDVLELENNPNLLDELAKKCLAEKILAIGEIGLDYHWNSVGYGNDKIIGKKAIDLQKKWFIKQIDLANELNLPVCIHSRDAEEDTLSILKEHTPKNNIVIHCYSYGIDSAKEYIKMGTYFGVGGTCTYKKNEDLREAIKIIPIEQIILETDAPYLTPEPNRRQVNDSRQITHVIDELALLKNISRDDVIKITNSNLLKAYTKLN